MIAEILKWVFPVLLLLVSSLASARFAWQRGFFRGQAEGREEAIAEIELNGVRRELHDANRTTLPREGARPARVSRIRFGSKIR